MIISDAEGDVIGSFDGTLIATRSMGGGDATPILICNGVGANLAPWKKVIVDLERERQVLSWDQRGLLGSGAPATDRLDVGAQTEDAVAVLDHYDAKEVVLASWSNGSRIALELATRYPERVRALIVVCGGPGHPFGRLLRHLEMASLLPTVAGIAKHFGASLQAPLRTLAARPELTGLIRQSGFVGPTADGPLLVELLRGIVASDMKTFLTTFELVAGDSAPQLARRVEAPALLVAGDKDQFTPLSLIREMSDAMSDATLKVYEKATHYLPIEYPARLSTDMRDFLRSLSL